MTDHIVIRPYRTPNGNMLEMALRPETVDEPVISATSIVDEYSVKGMDIRPGELFLDVGAYIGTVGLAVAKDFPEAKVVMIEAVPENVVVVEASIAHNGWGERVFVYNKAAADKPGESPIAYGAGDDDSSYQKDNRYIGNLRVLGDTHTIWVENITLVDIIKAHGPVAVLKIDCEGCEYDFLDTPLVAGIRFIVGEQHNLGQAQIVRLLAKTHDVTFQPDSETVGLFWATKR